MSALDDLILTLEQRHSIELDTERSELADLRARALPQAIVDAVRAYQSAHRAYVDFAMTTLEAPNDHPVLEAEREMFRAVYRAIEADAKGGDK